METFSQVHLFFFFYLALIKRYGSFVFNGNNNLGHLYVMNFEDAN